jgi:hypothetical protein
VCRGLDITLLYLDTGEAVCMTTDDVRGGVGYEYDVADEQK